MSRRRIEPMERFRGYLRIANDGCWNWIGGKTHNGYGQFWDGDKNTRAHRWAYEALVSPIPAGMELDHLCRNPGCVNPRHLEPVTTQENLRRRQFSQPAA